MSVVDVNSVDARLAGGRPAAMEEGRRGIQGASHEADSDTAMTSSKGEITRGDLIGTQS
jgi:hypothetical protein